MINEYEVQDKRKCLFRWMFVRCSDWCSSCENRCWAPWLQCWRMSPTTLLRKCSWRPEQWQGSPRGGKRSIPLLRYNWIWEQGNIIFSKHVLLKESRDLVPNGLCYAVDLFQLEASSLVADLSSSLLYMNVSEHGGQEMVQAATPIVEAASNILGVSSNASTQVIYSWRRKFTYT